MFQFLATYVKVLAAVLLALGVYYVTVVPAIEPTKKQRAKVAPVRTPLPTEYWWQDFFEEGSWQRESPNVIHAKQGVLISRNWKQLDEKTWELTPLTLIMPQSSKDQEALYQASAFDSSVHVADKEMWIVSADQGATIHFDEPFTFNSGIRPNVNRGELSGRIEVTRKTHDEDDERPWRLVASDLSINRRQVTTENEVLIEWGGSVIRGRSLRILLQGNLLSEQQAESPWGPLDELELYNVDEIDIELEPGGLWAGMELGRFKDEPQLHELPARLTATSGGRFSFDFKQSVARLQNGVNLIHQLGALPPDEFTCDHMTFQIEPPEKDSVESRMRVSSLEAFGVDSLRDFVGEKWVEITAPVLELKASAKEMQVDLERRYVELAGRLDQPGATQSTVRLEYEGHEFQSPRIEYQAPPKNAEQDNLGHMVAEGPGELRTNENGRLGGNHIRWQESLKMAPTPEGKPGAWLELDGNTLVESAERGFLASDRLEIWLQPMVASSTDATHVASVAGDYAVQRVYSATKTMLSSEILRAQVQELDLVLTYPPPSITLDGNGQPIGAEAVRSPESADSSSNELAMQDSLGNPMYQFVSPPEASVDQTAQDTKAKVARRPVSVTGTALTATIASASNQTWIEQLAISGPVKVWQEADEMSPEPEMPWHVEGNLMLANSNQAGQVDMQVEGRPARVVLADGQLEGPAIRVNQEHNIVLIDHPGECTLPKSMLKQDGQLGESQFEWVDAPHCTWQRRLLFDGQRVMIEGDVDFSGSLVTSTEQYWLLTGNCQRLDLVLTESIQLEDDQMQTAELDRLILREKVNVFASELDGQGEKRSRQHLFLPELTFHVPSEQIVGQGFGWVRSWFVQQGRLGRLASDRQATASLRGAHLQFRDQLIGKLGSSAVEFIGKVELFTSKLDHWDDPIQLIESSQLREGEFLLNADKLQVFDTQQLSASQYAGDRDHWEFQANGNIAFNGVAESGEFSGTGDRLSYQQAKEQLILRGTNRDPAFLQQRTTGPNPRVYEGNLNYIEIDAETMNPRNMVLGVGGFRAEDASENGSLPAQRLPQSRAVDPRRATDSFYNRR